MNIEKRYEANSIEEKWISRYSKERKYIANPLSGKPNYVILLPPPNVTGILTLGHVLNTTIQDVLIRSKRMQGYEVEWLPGTDHAGIATQNKVEQRLSEEGKTRFDLGREKFVEKVWEWKAEYHDYIVKQMKRLGLWCDWSREKFTMDEDFSRAVQEVFVRLYEKGYIYKGKYMVNYCPRCQTVISNEEVEAEESEGKLYYILYPLKDNGSIEVATTRPETMLGDTAVAVNPSDDRYKDLVGKKVILPLMEREIPVISDSRVDPDFGTGVVKITPAHDPDDFEIGKEHHLQIINIMDEAGNINENGGEYEGLERYRAREKIIEDLKREDLFTHEESHIYSIGHCSRCDSVIEPYISEQWFVSMEDFAKKARKAVEKGEVKFFLPRWKKVYYHWLDNIKDWVVSRQLWWGHRIPAYYCEDCGETIVSSEEVVKCTECGSSNVIQDRDVLDTWFSSWLWPFASFGWPDETVDLKAFFPSSVLVTGWDIIFLWVARMIMSSMEFMDDVPFEYVYFTGMVRDVQRRPLSKSLGNSPDPIELIEKYGSDALRLGMMLITPEGKDVIYKEDSIQQGRNFLNKIWNAFRLLMMNAENYEQLSIEDINLMKVDRWIISRTMSLVKETDNNLDSFMINETARILVNRFWHEFCDWYLEIMKPRLNNGNEEERKAAISVALWTFEKYLKLLHPFIPFITEEINELIPGERKELIDSEWPVYEDSYRDIPLEKNMEFLQDFITGVRNIRGEFNVSPEEKINVRLQGDKDKIELIKNQSEWIMFLSGLESIVSGGKTSNSAFFHLRGLDVYIPLEGVIDFTKEKERLSSEIEDLEQVLSGINARLSNDEFLEKAPEDVVKRTEEKKERLDNKIKRLKENLKKLS